MVTNSQGWYICGKGGKCPLCGDYNYCCRKKLGIFAGNGDCPTRAIQAAPLKSHVCVAPRYAQIPGKEIYDNA